MGQEPRSNRRRVIKSDLDADEHALMLAAQDPTNVPGIYNYCDRWCERCGFTARCLSFKMSEARERRKRLTASQPRSDQENAAFWDEVAANFALTLRLVRREAKKRGIDLDSPAAVEKAKRDERQRARQTERESSVLHAAATDCLNAARAILERLAPQLREAEKTLKTESRLGTGAPETTAAEIHDALAVIRWYLSFIVIKLQRAAASRVDLRADGDVTSPSDADGSAKVALVAIDRSIGAWARLREHLSGESDAILDILVHLERLRRSVEAEFPHAREFKRPGFD